MAVGGFDAPRRVLLLGTAENPRMCRTGSEKTNSISATLMSVRVKRVPDTKQMLLFSARNLITETRIEAVGKSFRMAC